MSVTTRKLDLAFLKSNGNEMKMVYNYIKENVAAASVKSLMQGLISNGSIFVNTPASMKSAKLIETNTTDIDLS